MKGVLLGSVDSGKTSFFRKFFSKVVEERQRTEQIRVVSTILKNQTLEILDCPGHTALTKLKDLAVTMADFVIYLVDAQKQDLGLLYKLYELGKPCVVLFNKVDSCTFFKEFERYSLKEITTNPVLRAPFYLEFSKLLKDTSILAPFLDNDLSRYICFPVSLKTGFGVEEFNSFLSNYVLKEKKKESTYLYATTLTSKKKEYLLLGKNKEGCLNFDRVYSLKELFSYDPLNHKYSLKKGFFNILSDDDWVLKVVEKDEPNVASRVPRIEIEEEKEDLKDLDFSLIQDYKFLVYSDNLQKKQILYDLLKDKVRVYKVDLSSQVFKDLIKKKQVFFELVQVAGSCYDFVYSQSSYYTLIQNFYKFYEKVKAQKIQAMEQVIDQHFVGSLLLDRVFKQEKKILVVGCKLETGTIRVGPVVLENPGSKQEILAELEGMHYNNKAQERWTGEKPCSLKLKVEDSFKVTERNFYRVKSVGLAQFLTRTDLPLPSFYKLKTYLDK